MNPFATPSKAIGSSSSQIATSGSITWLSQNIDTEQHSSPNPAMNRGGVRSTSRPTDGASAPEMTAIGTSSSADLVGDSPRTACAYSISGNAIAVIANPTVVIATFASEKLRSLNSPSGSNGSPRLRDCQKMKIASTTRPEMISDHTVIGPLI